MTLISKSFTKNIVLSGFFILITREVVGTTAIGVINALSKSSNPTIKLSETHPQIFIPTFLSCSVLKFVHSLKRNRRDLENKGVPLEVGGDAQSRMSV